ncbi:uncharacterized protein LOC142169811 [Nicotiana tabacum]|uniref:Uncharacterized protein LOC142169811 n=1 Tax=Nicotiana tabacum TaxID=4097 RepID=A0AC58SS85_TOBAC
MNIVSWNIRGLNKVYKQREIKQYLRDNKVVLIAIIEDKVKQPMAEKTIQKISRNWKWTDNYVASNRGRIWILWDPGVLDFAIHSCSEQLITGKIIIHQSHKEFWMTVVYGLHTIEHIKAMWEELEQLHNELQGPWIAMRDYNAIQSFEDRYNGNPDMEVETRDFSDFLENTGMTELKTVGREFMWTNNHVYSRIDRALVNARWMMNMTQLKVVLQDSLFSDHTPVCVYFEHDHQPMPKPFKFFNNLAEHKEFQRLVKDTWEVSMLRPTMQRIWMRLKRLKKD